MPRIIIIFLAITYVNTQQFIPSSYLDINEIVKFGEYIIASNKGDLNLELWREKIINIAIIENKTLSYFKPKIGNSLNALLQNTVLKLEPTETHNNYKAFHISILSYVENFERSFNRYIESWKEINKYDDLCQLKVIQSTINVGAYVSSVDSHLTDAFENIVHEVRYHQSLTDRCDINATIPDQIIAFYNVMASIERRKFIMPAFIYMIKSKCNVRDAQTLDSLTDLQSAMEQRVERYLHSVKLSAAYAPRDLYNCDLKSTAPGWARKDKNQLYIELEGYQRSVIINEKDQLAINTCTSTCPQFVDSEYIHENDIAQRHEYCHGRLKYCQTAGDVTYCKLRQRTKSSRPYQWITTATGATYGKINNCMGTVKTNETWTRFAVKCDYCICTCIDDVEKSPSRYAISLREEIADIENNQVVTGIRFIIKDQVIYAQIQTGKLAPQGNIVPTNVTWKSVNSLIGNRSVIELTDYVRFGTTIGDVKGINLDNIYAENDYVVTGIKFVLSREVWPPGHGASIGLDVLTTKYDFTTGKLIPYTDEWINPQSSIEPLYTKTEINSYNTIRSELVLDQPDNPLEYSMNRPDSKHGQYLQFQPSDLKKDAGQTTVPFFDATPVSGKPHFALGGIGIFHKGVTGSGGYVAFRIMSLDHTEYINTIKLNDEKNEGGGRLSILKNYGNRKPDERYLYLTSPEK